MELRNNELVAKAVKTCILLGPSENVGETLALDENAEGPLTVMSYQGNTVLLQVLNLQFCFDENMELAGAEI